MPSFREIGPLELKKIFEGFFTIYGHGFHLAHLSIMLINFQAASYNTFRDTLITNFQSPNLQRTIIRKNVIFF